MSILLSIISIAISIYNTIILIKLSKQLESLKEEKPKNKKKEEEKPVDESYLYSLEFNTRVDGLIQPILHKYPDATIIDKVFSKLIYDPKLRGINQQVLWDHIKDIFKNYNNRYQDLTKVEQSEEVIETISEVYNPMKNKTNTHTDKKPSSNKNTTNLDNVLNNFYRDY